MSMKTLLKLPRSRAAARAIDSHLYFTKIPCKHGHVAARYTCNTMCWDCKRIVMESHRTNYKNRNGIDFHTHCKYGGSLETRLKFLFRMARRRAVIQDLEFDLTPDFIIKLYNRQNGRCALTGVMFKFDKKNSKIYGPSIDRVNPNLGYTKRNVRIVRFIVNIMKNNLSDKQFKSICASVQPSL